VSDGFSHLMDFRAETVSMGEHGSELRLDAPKSVKFQVQVASRLTPQPEGDIAKRKFTEHPYWHVERARIPGTRDVTVELLQNGFPIGSTRISADGQLRPVEFTAPVQRSGWYAVRILPSAHTNPIFITVGGKPVRPSRKSVEWCLKSVDQCWSQKERFMKGEEIAQAREAYQHAREVYRARLAESDAD
jgi:hypothetical protein